MIDKEINLPPKGADLNLQRFNSFIGVKWDKDSFQGSNDDSHIIYLFIYYKCH